jgi:hypothetical protein
MSAWCEKHGWTISWVVFEEYVKQEQSLNPTTEYVPNVLK